MKAHFDFNNLSRNLPDAYRKDATSNNHKLLEVEKTESERLRAALTAIYESLDIDLATGSTLDEYGKMVGQERGKATDDQYRILIKARITRNLTNGDYNSIVKALAISLGCTPDLITLIELEEPCKVKIGAIPIEILNHLAVDVKTVAQIIRGIIPVGVFLEDVEFSGTFEFSDGTELVYDENAGFADEAQTIGGTLGYVFDGNTAELPA